MGPQGHPTPPIPGLEPSLHPAPNQVTTSSLCVPAGATGHHLVSRSEPPPSAVQLIKLGAVLGVLRVSIVSILVGFRPAFGLVSALRSACAGQFLQMLPGLNAVTVL